MLFLSPRVFSVLRTSPEGDEQIFAATNVTSAAVTVEIPVSSLRMEGKGWKELFSGREWAPRGATWALEIEPYGVVWLKPVDKTA